MVSVVFELSGRIMFIGYTGISNYLVITIVMNNYVAKKTKMLSGAYYKSGLNKKMINVWKLMFCKKNCAFNKVNHFL